MNEELIKAVRSLLSDIESIQQGKTDTFGGFYEWSIDGEEAHIEWPNLAISAAKVKALLDGQIIEGEKAAPQLPSTDYATEYEEPQR